MKIDSEISKSSHANEENLVDMTSTPPLAAKTEEKVRGNVFKVIKYLNFYLCLMMKTKFKFGKALEMTLFTLPNVGWSSVPPFGISRRRRLRSRCIRHG